MGGIVPRRFGGIDRDGAIPPKRTGPHDGGEERIRWRTVLAKICDKFRCLPSERRVRRLTWFQVVEIIFHERDEHGIILWKKKRPLTAQEGFEKRWKEWGLTDEQVAYKWDEFLQVEGYKYSLEQKGVKQDEIKRLAIEFERGIVAKRRW